MKLRIKGNSIRLRLTRPEVETLGAGRAVEEETRFADGAAFRYKLAVDPHAQETGATFADGLLLVRLPGPVVARWARDIIVGLEHSVSLRDGGQLRILVEKDFACLSPGRTAEDADAYPNPGKCRSLGTSEED